MAQYPLYRSKHNPIEHRVFPHLARACQGVILHTVEIVRQLIERAKTSTGLSVTVDILEKTCATGRQCAEDFKNTMKILFDAYLPKWNYRAHPESGQYREVISDQILTGLQMWFGYLFEYSRRTLRSRLIA
jgi:hypothetical protein